MLPLSKCSLEAKLPKAQPGNKSHQLTPAKPAAAADFTFKAHCVVRNPRTLQAFGKLSAGNVKRSLVWRCLVVPLSLALASGNALHLDAAHSKPCPEGH
jgi:hypothetical protein